MSTSANQAGSPARDIDMISQLARARETATEGIAEAGDHLTGEQRIAAWSELRASATNELDALRRAAISPSAVDGEHSAVDGLSAAAVDVVHRLASDPGRLIRAWAEERIDQLGEEVYTELVGVTAICSVIDSFDDAMGSPLRPLPPARPSSPSGIRPDDVGDVGAWVSQALDKTRANVSRALTLVPQTQALWRPLVDSHYSRGTDFFDLQWERALDRPQVELIAARTTALNECFY